MANLSDNSVEKKRKVKVAEERSTAKSDGERSSVGVGGGEGTTAADEGGGAVTNAEIERLYTTFSCLGPVGRICLQTINIRTEKHYNESLDIYEGQVSREIDAFITMGGRENLEGSVHETSSHKIILMEPLKDGRAYTPRLSTRWIAYRVYEKALQRSQQDCFVLYKHLSQQDNLRSAAGWFFERYAHDWFRQGGIFRADEIPITDQDPPSFQFEIKKSTARIPNYFTTPQDLAKNVRSKSGKAIKPEELKKYFLPYISNYGSIDGLVFSDPTTVVLFQITLAEKHEIKPHGVAELLRALPAKIRNVQIVFVIPQNRIANYAKRQRVPDSNALDLGRKKLEVRQFRLILRDEDMKAVSGQGPFEPQEEDDSDQRERL